MVGESLSKFFDVLGKILAILTIILYAVFVINANWQFITNVDILNILALARYYAPLILVCIVGIEFAVKRDIVLQIIIYVVIAAIIIFQFFPGTWEAILGSVGA